MRAENRMKLAELNAAIAVTDSTALFHYREARKNFKRAESLTRQRDELISRAGKRRAELTHR